MSKMKSLFVFALGGAVGFLVAKRYYEENNRREPFDEAEDDSPDGATIDHEQASATVKRKRDISNYEKYTQDIGYRGENTVKASPRVIAPDEFGINDEYEQFSLTYYADAVLTDDTDRAMTAKEIEQTVGTDALSRFGEYEPDSVFVRNDELRCYYEILLDEQTYSDVVREKPYILQEE